MKQSAVELKRSYAMPVTMRMYWHHSSTAYTQSQPPQARRNHWEGLASYLVAHKGCQSCYKETLAAGLLAFVMLVHMAARYVCPGKWWSSC